MELNGASRTDLLVRSRTIKSHKLMNPPPLPVSPPLSIGLLIGLRSGAGEPRSGHRRDSCKSAYQW